MLNSNYKWLELHFSYSKTLLIICLTLILCANLKESNMNNNNNETKNIIGNISGNKNTVTQTVNESVISSKREIDNMNNIQKRLPYYQLCVTLGILFIGVLTFLFGPNLLDKLKTNINVIGNETKDIAGDENTIIQYSNDPDSTNKIGKIEGNGNFILQLLDEEGKFSKEKIEAMLKPIAQKASLLSNEVNERQSELNYINKEIEELSEEIGGKYPASISNLYKDALNLFLSSNIDEALKLLDEKNLELNESQHKDNSEDLANTRKLKARMLICKKNYDEAGKNYEIAIDLNTTWKNYFQTANFFRFRNDISKTNKYYDYCKLKAEDSIQKAKTYHAIGQFYRKLNKPVEAINSYTIGLKALENTPKDNHIEIKSSIYNSVAVISSNLYRFNRDEKHYFYSSFMFNESLKLDSIQKVKKPNCKSRLFEKLKIFNNYGLLEGHKRNFKTCFDLFEKAISINPKSNNKYLSLLAVTYSNYASIFLEELKDPVEAEKKLLNAEKIYRKLVVDDSQRYQADLSVILNNIGKNFKDQKKYDEAENYYLEAIEIVTNLHLNFPQVYGVRLASCQMNLANCYKAQNKNRSEILKLAESAKEQLLKYPNDPDAIRCLGELDAIFKDMEGVL